MKTLKPIRWVRRATESIDECYSCGVLSVVILWECPGCKRKVCPDCIKQNSEDGWCLSCFGERWEDSIHTESCFDAEREVGVE